MIPQIKKILYATDLSKNSAYAFFYAVDMAKRHNARIVIVHAVEPIHHVYTEGVAIRLKKARKTSRRKSTSRNRRPPMRTSEKESRSFVRKWRR